MKITRRFLAALVAFVLTLGFCVSALAYTTIQYGANNDDVRKMQLALKDQGYYSGAIDGDFGPTTRTAVRKFQKKIGLTVDGKPGNKTLTALYEGKSAVNTINNRKQSGITPKNASTLCYGCEGDRVKQLQRALKAAGYYNGSIDGQFGDLTETAVKKYQTARGLHVDGMAGKSTIASLNKVQNKVTVSSSFLLTSGSRGDLVRNVQGRLSVLGYSVTDPKGYYGESTMAAVKQYQQDHNQTVTGTLTQTQYARFITAPIT